MNPQSEVTYLEDGVIATFSVEPKLNQYIFETTGVREFTNQEMVRIRIPGDKMMEVVEEVRPDHKHRFKNTYKAFVEGTNPDNGTPLANFGDIDPATVEKLKYLGIGSIEALASVSDSSLSQIGARGRELRDRAARYLDTNSSDKVSHKIQEQNEQIQAMQAQIEKLLAAKSPKTEEKRSVGRPKAVPPHMEESN